MYESFFPYILKQHHSGSLIQEAMKIFDLRADEYRVHKIEIVKVIFKVFGHELIKLCMTISLWPFINFNSF